jgi:EAL domain-containing protein (putative c-di-GMP-specific phosphodiesterase class I)
MNKKAYAVFIGINIYSDSQYLPPLTYAEKDCQDCCHVLTNSETGIFLPENVTLLLGQNATTNNIREVLFREIVQKPTANDTVLVYFSGHGFILGEKQQKAYLGTYDVDVTNLITKNRRSGLGMDELYEDIFSASPAKYVLFILDSCHSGAFVPSVTKGTTIEVSKMSTNEKLVEQGFFSGENGRIAIVSCPPDLPSYESKEFQNSIFTYYLLAGLKGGAVEQDTGEVTVDSLLTYIRNHAPSNQIPGRYGQDYGRIILAKSSPNWEEQTQTRQTTLLISKAQSRPQKPLEVIPLKNHLEPYQVLIDGLISYLTGDYPITSVENRVLEAVKNISHADFVAVLRQSKTEWIIRAQSNFDSEETQSNYVENVVSQILPIISSDPNIFSRGYYGSSLLYEENKVTKALIFVPLQSQVTNDLMVVCGLSPDSYLLGEVYGRILDSLYSATHELTSVQPSLIEAAILDELKQSYGFVSMGIYNRRFQLFCERLQQMKVHFQPILYLSPKRPYIYSWEALARDINHGAAPIDLFKAAELWGIQFMIELDIYFMQNAIIDYHAACLRTPGKRRSEDIQELSINVYPESLMHDSYFKAVKQILAEEELLQPEKIILEISEKSPLPVSLEFFRTKIKKYVRDLKIGFAIDDFGVGHASVHRLAGLNPASIKIDRDILHQATLQQEIFEIICRFVLDIASEGRSHAPKVVIEGFDSKSSVTLAQLYQLGIRYVQGYIIGKAGSELIRLDAQQIEYLKTLINN